MKPSVANFLNHLETLRPEIVWDGIPYLSLKHYSTAQYRNHLDELHQSATNEFDPGDQPTKAKIERLKRLFEKVWDMLSERPTSAEFSDQVFLQRDFLPLFVGAQPETWGNVNDAFIADLHDLIEMREGLLWTFDTYTPSGTPERLCQRLIALIHHENDIQIDSTNMDEIAIKYGWTSKNSGLKIKNLYNKLADKVYLEQEKQRYPDFQKHAIL